ncbi:ABC transporter substrate-binding protein [Halanaerobacter jeridensis]|uniref:Raffinose/stachyose/melibiose transport system substrate-binding protein n=1 Tax=Halanaerobacter jeridensis TaxID=706427 RepID=A0A939BM23_9FIRM|nr:ABC transporter substrate-binding protein [Halanaerobacter jeridensis]MBM7555455.1 raffinose/stachyose/melibiose transport system substrate-binding protein [Halanaerobacter jeridensis]
MKSKGKLMVILSLVLVFGLLITGCGADDTKSTTENSSDENSAAKVKVNIFQFKVEVKDALEDAAEKYMAENPNVELKIQTVGGGDDYGAALRSKFASGNEPAVFNVGGPQDVADWKNKLEDLSDQSWVDLAYNGVLDGVTVDDKVFGLPFNQEGYGFIYNKSIFKKAGIEAESIKSYAELKAAVEKLDSQKEELGLKSVFAFPAKETWVTGLHLSNAALSNEFENVLKAYESKEVDFKYGEGLKKLIDLQADYAYKPDGTKGSLNAVDYATQVEELFSLEQVAIIQQGNWAYGSIAGIDKQVAQNVGFLPMPVVGSTEDSIPVGIPMYWAVNNAKSKEVKDAAKDFLSWLYTSEQGKKIVINDFGFIPALRGYEGPELEPSDPLARDILKYSNQDRTMPWVFMGYPSGWGMNVLGTNIQSYLAGDMTWDQLVKDSQKEWAKAREE